MEIQIMFLVPTYLAPETTHLAPRGNGGCEIALKSTTILPQEWAGDPWLRERELVGTIMSHYILLDGPLTCN